MKRDIDFLKVYKTQSQTKQRAITLNKSSEKAALISTLVVVAASGVVFGYGKYLDKLVEEKQLSINTSTNASSYYSILDKQVIYEDVRKYNEMADKVKTTIESSPQLTNIEYNTLKNNLVQGMLILDMNYFNDQYIITLSAPYARNIPQYVSNIKNTGIFSRVSYDGYSQQSNSFLDNFGVLQNTNHYVFTITCTLKSGVNNETN